VRTAAPVFASSQSTSSPCAVSTPTTSARTANALHQLLDAQHIGPADFERVVRKQPIVHDGLHARPTVSGRPADRDVRTGGGSARGAEQPVQPLLRHDRLHGGHRGHLMPVRLGSFHASGTDRGGTWADRDDVPSRRYHAPGVPDGQGARAGVHWAHDGGAARSLAGALDGGATRCASPAERSSTRDRRLQPATRASRTRIYFWTATGVCSHRSGGKGGRVLMGLDPTRRDTG
jgi:hypothetical protein